MKKGATILTLHGNEVASTVDHTDERISVLEMALSDAIDENELVMFLTIQLRARVCELEALYVAAEMSLEKIVETKKVKRKQKKQNTGH